MSRVGKKPVEIPNNVKIEIRGDIISVEGPKGKLEHKVPGDLKVSKKDNALIIERSSASKEVLSLWGLTRAILFNLVKGVTEGYTKQLEIKGVGFKAGVEGQTLRINLGYSHPVRHVIPEGITVTTPKPTQIVVSGIDKIKVGEIAAEIREYFRPEPYTGKGIKYVDENVKRKAGKTIIK